MAVTPNRNLVQYDGFEGGTHTRIKRKNKQPPIETLSFQNMPEQMIYNQQMDRWTSKNMNRDTPFGLIETAAASLALGIIKTKNLRN